jgi:phage tail protein X
MAHRFISYTTTVGDRWDTIAWKFYGDAMRYHPIILANPAVAIYPVMPPGKTLSIPILTPSPTTTILPPWLR